MYSETLLFITKALKNAKRPAVLWSGGKDSTVLLYLAKQVMPHIELVHWRVPFLPEKYQFHNLQQENNNLTVHDWTPVRLSLTDGNDRIDVCETYQIGSAEISVMRGTEPFEEGRPWVCGLEWLSRPTGTVNAPFDVLLCGHKSCDIDPISGGIPLSVDMKRAGDYTQMWFPLRNWSDKEIYDFILKAELSFDRNRYNDDVTPKTDKHLNSDYFHSCMRCVDKRESAFVRCPKLGIDVENISNAIRHEYPSHSYCGLRT